MAWQERTAHFAVAAGVMLTMATSARADDAEAAARHFDAGNTFYRQSQFAAAEAEFQQAWDQHHTFDIAANLGDCEVEIGQYRDAAEHLAYAQHELPISAKDTVKQRVNERLAKARAQVGGIRVHVTPTQATVHIGSREYSPLPDEIFVEPGIVKVEAALPGFAPASTTVVASKGTSQDATLTLVALPAAAATDEPRSRKSLPLILAGAGVTAAAIGAGVAFIVVSGGKASDADAERTTVLAATPGNSSPCFGAGASSAGCSKLSSLNGDADSFSHVAVAMFVGAGVVGAATLTYALWPSRGTTPTPPAAGFHLAPAVGPTFAGASFGSSF